MGTIFRTSGRRQIQKGRVTEDPWRVDYNFDFFLTTDEATCPASDWFQCSYGQCIAYSKRCDGVDQCSDGSDENATECKCNNLKTFLTGYRMSYSRVDLHRFMANKTCILGGLWRPKHIGSFSSFFPLLLAVMKGRTGYGKVWERQDGQWTITNIRL